MNKDLLHRIFRITNVISVLVLALLFSTSINTISFNFQGKASEDFSIILDSKNAISSSGTYSLRTKQRGNVVRFEYKNVKAYSEGHVIINEGGSIKNVDQLTSISSITATFYTDGSLYFRASYDSSNWTKTYSLESGVPYDLPSNPYYIEFLTDGVNYVAINSLEFEYTCKVNPNILSIPKIYDGIEIASVDLTDLHIGSEPYGLKLSYYSNNGRDIYGRGFSWSTDTSITDSELYLVESSLGEDADFSLATLITGSCATNGSINAHKVVSGDLLPSTTYSYKVGSSYGWSYGTFTTDNSHPHSFKAIQLSDAQTKVSSLLNVWENTFAQAVETAGSDLDFVIFNGDQSDANSDSPNQFPSDYAGAIETISGYLGSTPYMTSSGNHEGSYANYVFTDMNCLNYAKTSTKGGYYSYNYGDVHFVTLNTNDATSTSSKVDVSGFTVSSSLETQARWLIDDLERARSDEAKWIIVNMHIGAYATGDHSNGTQVKNILTSLTPIFSAYHVDLVLQAHDHVYNKTLPYKWDSAGYTTTYNNTDVINFSYETQTIDGIIYDKNPNGTYYVTTGAAGHRYGAAEKADGIWADVNDSTGFGIHPSRTFTNNIYKVEVGRINKTNSYEPYTYDGFTSDQIFNVGDYATGNVNATMFGVLNVNHATLRYDFYTVRGNEVKLFDSLNILKT